MKEGIKCSAVFIGTVIGAGFATGREIALYFGKNSPFSAMAAGLVLSVFGCFFMYIGRELGDKSFDTFLFGKFGKLYKIAAVLCAFITFIAMFAGAESIIYSISGVKHIGIITAVLAVVCAIRGVKFLKIINILAVPSIVFFIALIFFKSKSEIFVGKISVLTPIAYASLNIMLGGCVMAKLGKNCDKKDILWCFVFSTLVFSMLLLLLSATVKASNDEMPLFSIAKIAGLSYASGILIFMAIFTTMVSSAEYMIGELESLTKSRLYGAMLVMIFACPLSAIFSFKTIVDSFYPFVSVCGVLLIIFTIIRFAQKKCSLYAE